MCVTAKHTESTKYPTLLILNIDVVLFPQVYAIPSLIWDSALMWHGKRATGKYKIIESETHVFDINM